MKYLNFWQFSDHFDFLLKNPPQGLFGCRLVVVFVLLQGYELLP